MTRVDCIVTDAELARFAPEWMDLWRRVPAATPFQAPAWLVAWWRHFGNGRLRVLAARRAGVLEGVLPLYELPEPDVRKLLPIGIGLSDYLDALVDPARPATADALLKAVGDVPDWQECHLPDLPPGSALASAGALAGVSDEIKAMVPCPVLVLPGSAAALASVVPRKILRDVRQAIARSSAAGGANIETADANSLPGFLDDLFRLHELRWREREEPGVLADPAVQAFHRAAAPALAACGLLRLFRLRIAGAVAAVYYGFHCRRNAYAYIGGFDPTLPRLSPGAQLLFHAIGAAIDEGAAEFHFLRGGESYKYAWGAVDRWNTARTLRRS